MKSVHDRLILPGILLALFISLTFPQVLFAGADVQNGFSCTVNALDTGLPEPLTSTETHSVVTPNGNSVLVCKFQGPADSIYESAYQNRGFLCGTFAGATYNSKVVVTPSGRVIFTCHVHPNKREEPPADQSSTTDDQPVDAPSGVSSGSGNNGNGQGNGNSTSAPQGSEEPAITSEDETSTTPETPGPGNSGNQGNGNGNSGGNGNGNGNNGGGNGNGNSGGNGNGNSGGNGNNNGNNGNGNGHGNRGG